MTDVTEFGSHMPSVLRGNTSVSAAGALLVWASLADVSAGSSDRIQECIVPGWIGNHSAALKAVLVNCGDKPISLFKEANLNVTSAPADHQGGIEFFLKAIGFANVMAITQTWSQSYFKKGHKVSPEEAEYFHGYLRLEIKAVHAMLRLGGYDGFFPTLRTFQKANDPAYRVLQLRGYSLIWLVPELCYRLKSLVLRVHVMSFGIRVASERYNTMKRKLQGLCRTVHRSTLKAALRSLKWAVRVSKASGFRAWMVFSCQEPPTGSFTLNKATIVVIRVDAETTGPIVASSQKQTPKLQLKLPAAAVSATPIPIPSEANTKFEQIAAQSTAAVGELEAKVNKLSQSLQEVKDSTDTRIQSVENEVKSVSAQVKQQHSALDSKLESMLDQLFSNQKSCMEKLEKSNEQAVQALRQEYQSGYSELKDIFFRTHPRRGKLPFHRWRFGLGSPTPRLC